MPPERVFLIDGTALAYRSHFAFIRAPLFDPRGRNTSAVYGFTATLVKGRGNYLCWRRFERLRSEVALFDDEADSAGLAAIAEWAQKTADGTLSDLPFVPARDLWSQVCSESDTCRAANCADVQRCFVARARRAIRSRSIRRPSARPASPARWRR